jgi:hypothetical protein
MAFFHDLNEREFGQLIGFAANFSGTVQAGIAVINFLRDPQNPFGPNDTDKILDAINQLKQQIAQGFADIGNLILQQATKTNQTINTDTIAAALGNSDAAVTQINRFLDTQDTTAAEQAEELSAAGVAFFKERVSANPTADDLPFFIPGMMKAGSLRIFVLAREPVAIRLAPQHITEEINGMSDALSTMINVAKQQTDNAHILTDEIVTIHCPREPDGGPGPPGPGTVPKTLTVLKGDRELNVVTRLCSSAATSEPSDGPNARTGPASPPKQTPVAGETRSMGGPPECP